MWIAMRRLPSVLLAWLLAVATGAHAQLHRATDPVATPASSLVLKDDALAVDVNPAALVRLPAWSFALLHSEVDERVSWLGRGDAAYVALPVIGPLAFGATLQSIRPGDLAARPPGDPEASRAMAALSLAFAASDTLGFGLTTRTFYSGNGRFDGLTALDAGVLLRPSPWLAVSLVGRDLFVSRSGFGTGGLDLATSALLSAGLRPFGNGLTIDVGLAMAADDAEQIGARGGVVLALPYVGTASGLIEVDQFGDSNAVVRVMAELAVSLGGFTAVGGGAGGDRFDDDLGWYAMLRAEGQDRAGIPVGSRVLELQLKGLSARDMTGIALALERVRNDRRIGGVLLKPRGSDMGLAYAQELRLQIKALRERGKTVVCHLDSASGSEYYACAAANQILIDPAGDIRLMGSATTVLLFGETLRKIGVRADFIRIGPYKSAPEQYTQQQLSDAAREHTRAILDDAHRRVLADLATDLGKPQHEIAEIMDRGPQLARAAQRARMIKGMADEYDLDTELRAAFGREQLTRELPPDETRDWGKRPAIGVVMVDEEIVDGESVDVPFIDIHMTGGDTVVRTLESMAADPRVRAIVLRVDSPGGAALASEKIWRAVRRARERKPVIASMGAVAASGGYYVACAADEIWADPSTVTGSIGIFYGKVDVTELASTIGVGIEHFRRGKRAGAESLFRPFTDDERAALADVLRNYYNLFLTRVAEGRGMSVEAVDSLARGRVYSGDAAQRIGLVDRLGGLASALIRARELAGLGVDAEIDVRPDRFNTLLDYVLGGSLSVSSDDAQDAATAASGAKLSLPPQARSLVRMVMMMEQLGTGQPLALMPFQLDL
jgi:protease-4